MSFIQDNANFMKKHYQVDDNWATMCSTALMSSIIGRTIHITTNRPGETYLNMMFVGLAPSRYGHKSSGFQHIKNIFHDNKKRTFISNSIATSSIEGMSKLLSKEPAKFIFEDEVSKTFDEKNYNKGMSEFVSQLYDGMISGRTTIKHGIEESSDVYTTLLGAGALSFFSKISSGLFEQGLGNRILWARWGSITKTLQKADTTHYNSTYPAIQKFIDVMMQDDMMLPVHHLPYSVQARSMIERSGQVFYDIGRNMDEYDDRRGIYAKAYLHTMKLAAVHAIGRMFWKGYSYPYTNTHLLDTINSLVNSNQFIIQPVDADWAIDQMNYYIDQFNNVVKEWSDRRSRKTVVNERADIEMVTTAGKELIGNIHEEISYTSWLESTGLKKPQFDIVIETLKESGKLIQLSVPQLNVIPKPERNNWYRVNAKIFSFNITRYKI